MLGFVYALSQGGVLAEMAEKNPNTVVVSQDMGPISPFSEKFPDRFFDVGISEGNLRMVEAARSVGASAKCTGSGGGNRRRDRTYVIKIGSLFFK